MGVRGNAVVAYRICTPIQFSNFVILITAVFRIAQCKMCEQNKATKIIFYQGQGCIHMFPFLSRKVAIANQGKCADIWSQKAPSTGISQQKRRLYSPVQTEKKGDNIHIVSTYIRQRYSLNFIRLPQVVITPSITSESTGR